MVEADISSASIIGIPACNNVLIVLANEAHADLVCNNPNTGIFNFNLSRLCLPFSVLPYNLTPTTIPITTIRYTYQYPLTLSLIARIILVVIGSSESRSSNIVIKLGITNVSITTITPIITKIRTIGYIIAFLTTPFNLASFSNCTAIRVREFSKLPEASPALIISTRILGNSSFSLIESERFSPFSTLDWVLSIASLSLLFSVCSPSISNALITLTPALRILANCRQNTLISRAGIFFGPKNDRLTSLSKAPCLPIDIGVKPCSFIFLAASSLLSASTAPLTSFPEASTALYENVSISHSPFLVKSFLFSAFSITHKHNQDNNFTKINKQN